MKIMLCVAIFHIHGNSDYMGPTETQNMEQSNLVHTVCYRNFQTTKIVDIVDNLCRFTLCAIETSKLQK